MNDAKGLGARRRVGLVALGVILVSLLTACALIPQTPQNDLPVAKPFGDGEIRLDLNSMVPNTTFLILPGDQSESRAVVVGTGRRALVDLPRKILTSNSKGVKVIARAPCYRESRETLYDANRTVWGKTFQFTDHDRDDNGPGCGGIGNGNSDRVALVIGNQDYWLNQRDKIGNTKQTYGLQPLKKAVPDAQQIADALRAAHFTLVGEGVIQDVTKERFGDAIRAFRDRSRTAKISVFYYAGHGYSWEGKNWIVPVDFRYYDTDTYRTDLIDPTEAIDAMGSAPDRIRVLILDACRSPPLPGLKQIRPEGKDKMPPNTILAYATQAGDPASDGGYSQYLAEAMRIPHLDLPDIFRKAAKMTHQHNPQQSPIFHSTVSATSHYYILP